jgi:hypothetical protein
MQNERISSIGLNYDDVKGLVSLTTEQVYIYYLTWYW